MDRFWLKNYPPGVPADIDPSVYPSLVSLLEESFAKYRDRQGLCLHGQGAHFRRGRRSSRQALAAWLQSRGLGKRRPRGDHDAQRAAVPGRGRGGPARPGLIAVNVNPLYTRARARAPAEGFRRRGGDRARELRERRLQQAIGRHAGEACRAWRRWATCSGFPKGTDRQLRRAHGAQDGAGLFAAGPLQVQRRDRRGPAMPFDAGRACGRTTSRCCSTPAARPASPRARRCCIAPSSPTCWRRRPGCSPALQAQDARPASSPSSARCRSITSSRFITCGLLGMRTGGAQHPDPQSARHEGHDQGARQVPASTSSRRSTRCSTDWPITPSSPSSTSPAW